ncbi:TPA: hypothetical protein ACH3X1_007020 [Trebouxia sp. C0004]
MHSHAPDTTGDSLTDDCTHGAKQVVDAALDSTANYPGEPYYQGCFFSSGPTYAVVAAGLLNVSLTDYAVGGATSGAVIGSLHVAAGFGNNTAATVVEVPSAIEQAEAYIASQNGTVPTDALYIVFIGANDYLHTIEQGANATVEEVLMYTGEAMDMLYVAGARVFLTQTQFSYGSTPGFASAGPEAVMVGNKVTRGHNEALAPFLAEFATEHLEASIITFDFAAFLVGVSQNATALGFTDTTTPCYTGAVAGTSTAASNPAAACANPDQHIFWDGEHPTGHTHQLWGEALAAQIRPIMTPAFSSSSSRKLLKKAVRGAMDNSMVHGCPL